MKRRPLRLVLFLLFLALVAPLFSCGSKKESGVSKEDKDIFNDAMDQFAAGDVEKALADVSGVIERNPKLSRG